MLVYSSYIINLFCSLLYPWHLEDAWHVEGVYKYVLNEQIRAMMGEHQGSVEAQCKHPPPPWGAEGRLPGGEDV